MNINLAINLGSKILRDKLIPNPFLDSEILMAKTLNKDRNFIIAELEILINQVDKLLVVDIISFD